MNIMKHTEDIMNKTNILGKSVPDLIAPSTEIIQEPLPFNQASVKQSTAPALLGPGEAKPYFTVRFALPVPPITAMLATTARAKARSGSPKDASTDCRPFCA